MYLVDTNVLSEVRRKTPAAMSWMASVDPTAIYISVISLGEIMKGAEMQMHRDPQFSRRLLHWLDGLHEAYDNRILPITLDIAFAWGRIAAGRSRSAPDALLGATARIHDLTLVTRNVRDFWDIPIAVLNPWDPDPALPGR
ncbi:plasmid stabilization protein [Bosea sp. AAP35]|uniref:type II toxin-antitoxin system VapC family toxin n=1 Tax=Bosea sp. AAP35 TaxID=1523417 RepID=UPI0006B92B22|nr:type II toxin-antitoxin system VapC family toxin [Bosea sp. AAP35]KPF68079.1 plasmid stabilization protein [Bosea sp. AAP35]